MSTYPRCTIMKQRRSLHTKLRGMESKKAESNVMCDHKLAENGHVPTWGRKLFP